MITIRKSQDRGHADHGWLLTYHSFSFADYYDPQEMGWGTLRVINEDRVHPGEGFGTHSHKDMEIVTYVLEGQLEHKDSMGNGAVIQAGDVQRMSAGTGVRHSEFNPSSSELVHFLQIWILPESIGITPGYEQKRFSAEDKRGKLRLVASRDGREGSVTVHQSVDLYDTLLSRGDSLSHPLATGHLAYLHLIQGVIDLNGLSLKTGDGAKIESEQNLTITTSEDSEILLFDMVPPQSWGA